MAAYNKIQSFVEALAEKQHNLATDSLTIALTASASPPNSGTSSLLANLSQISYTNLTSRVLVQSTSAQAAGTYKLVINDLVLTASGGSAAAFGNVVMYNDTPSSPADPLIAWWEYGSDVTLLTSETFTIDFDGSGGVLTIA